MPETPDSAAQAVAANRRAWDAAAPLHLNGEDWAEQVTGFATPGYSTFDPVMTALLNGEALAGKSVVQVGCNNGRETLSLAAFGATRCLGIDQSAAFLEQAEILRGIAGSDAEFLRADIYALPATVRRDFDAALITIGVLNWMPDLPRFLSEVAGLLRPGGRLIIYETHPFLEMFEPGSGTPHMPTTSYFHQGALIDTDPLVYDGSGSGQAPPTHWFIYRICDVLNGVIAAGCTLRSFEEYAHSNREVEYDIYAGREAQLPMCFTLVAEKAG